jgi:hypothetical protein
MRLAKCGLAIIMALCSASNSVAKEPNALFGAGTLPCKVFASKELITASRNPVREVAFSWAQGWFSARNFVGHEDNPLTVGGTLSSVTLESLLVDECSDFPNLEVWEAAQRLYERLAKKGL